MNKTQYTTRMISKTLEPVFEETAVLLVDANAAKIGEKVTLEVWDSDRFTNDDHLGRVEVEVAGTLGHFFASLSLNLDQNLLGIITPPSTRLQ